MKPKRLKPTQDTIGDADFDKYRKFTSRKLQIFTRRQRKKFYEALENYIDKCVFSDSFRVLPNENGEPKLLQIGFPKSITTLEQIGCHIKLLHLFKRPKTAEKYEPVLFKRGESIFPIKQIFTGFFFEKEHYENYENIYTQTEFYHFVWGDLILRKNLIEECEFATKRMKEEWRKAFKEAENQYDKTKQYKAGEMVKSFNGTKNVNQIMAELFELVESGIKEEVDRDSDTTSDESEDNDIDDREEEIKFGGKSKSSKGTWLGKLNETDKSKHKRIGSDESKTQSNKFVKGSNIESTSKISLKSKQDCINFKNDANSLKRSFESCLMQADENNASNKSKKMKNSSYIIEKKSNECKLEREKSISKQAHNQIQNKSSTKGTPELKFSNISREATPKQKKFTKIEISKKTSKLHQKQ